jgi:hypothetical protein
MLTQQRQTEHLHPPQQILPAQHPTTDQKLHQAAGPNAEFVKAVNQTVRGWMNYYRHTNASDAFRRLQRFINTRFRRYLNYRSKGRGFGWKKYPNAALYTLGIIYIGSGVIRYE